MIMLKLLCNCCVVYAFLTVLYQLHAASRVQHYTCGEVTNNRRKLAIPGYLRTFYAVQQLYMPPRLFRVATKISYRDICF